MAAGEQAMKQGLVAELRARIDNALSDLVDLRHPVALLDYPDHGNPGDAAIWLGTTEWLRRRSARVVYLSDWITFSPRALKRRIGRGTIIFHGGGNFGPLYVDHHRFRGQVIESFAGQPMVLMPQTLEFSADAMIRQSAQFLARFPRLWAHLTPGMTGPWQVLGTSRIPLDEMVTLDYLYVAHWSLWNDVKIMLRTIGTITARRGR